MVRKIEFRNLIVGVAKNGAAKTMKRFLLTEGFILAKFT